MAVLKAVPLDIGRRTELMVDTFLLESWEGLRFRQEHPTPAEKSVLLDKPWNSAKGSGVYNCVVKDGDEYRLYYRGMMTEIKNDEDDNQCFCLAVSSDGIHWEEPLLDVLEWNGQKTNVVFYGSLFAHNFCVFIDTNPSCVPEEKYKAVAGHSSTGGLFAFVSEDGIHWRKKFDFPIITDGAFDSQNEVFYDNFRNEYVCYSRSVVKMYAGAGKYHNIRCIQSCRSEDFLHWTQQVQNIYEEGKPTEQYYTNAVTPVPGAEHIFVAFPMRFFPDREKISSTSMPEYGQRENGVSDSAFLASHDGIHWHRGELTSFITPGMDPKVWTQRNFITAHGIAKTADDEFSIYVNEHYDWPDSYIRRYTLPRNRFMSLTGDWNGGTLVTKPFCFEGGTLFINYATDAAGSVVVRLTDDDGNTAVSEEIFGNSLDEAVEFGGSTDVSAFSGKSVAMEITIKNGSLYGFRFE